VNLAEIHSVYFLGIGGIGMSAIARWFNANGVNVKGYDKTETVLTQELSDEGIQINYEDTEEAIPTEFQSFDSGNLIVFTPAIPADCKQLNKLLSIGYEPKKRSEVLGIITRDYFTIAVAGTHGKTSTSSMISHILKNSGRNVMAFIGGILQNYQSNLLINDPGNSEQPIVVVEADEFDRSFHRLSPNVVVLTTVDPDHLDIYHTENEFEEGFIEFLQKIEEGGKLIVNECVVEHIHSDFTSHKVVYGQHVPEGFTLQDSVPGKEVFTLSDEVYELGVSGIHNVHNAVGAVLAVKSVGLKHDEINSALSSFNGVKRRFEYIVNRPEAVYIDDYAHHPSEIQFLVESLRRIYPNRKITGVFQPHLFSRTQDFMDGFASELSKLDQLILLDVYPARELPIEGVTSDVLFEKITLENKCRSSIEEAVNTLSKLELDIVVTIGAGDIDLLVNPIKNMLELDQLIA